MLNYWDRLGLLKYEKMRKRHPRLWRRVQQFVRAHKIQSVLEVGCGMNSPIRGMTPKYVGVDLNSNSDAEVINDFCLLDPAEYRGFDLILACAVIEHCPGGYEPFFRQIRAMRPKFALISFFKYIERPDNHFNEKRRGFWVNKYSKERMEETLDQLGFIYVWEKIRWRDRLLMLR